MIGGIVPLRQPALPARGPRLATSWRKRGTRRRHRIAYPWPTCTASGAGEAVLTDAMIGKWRIGQWRIGQENCEQAHAASLHFRAWVLTSQQTQHKPNYTTTHTLNT